LPAGARQCRNAKAAVWLHVGGLVVLRMQRRRELGRKQVQVARLRRTSRECGHR